MENIQPIRTWREIAFLGVVGLLLTAAFGFWCGEKNDDVLKAPFEVPEHYFTAKFGDFEAVTISSGHRENPSPGDSDDACYQFRYAPSRERDSKGWAGVYWLRPDANWGKRPGATIENASKVTFWARGERGGELVRFKVGGIRNYGDSGLKYSDSLEVAHGQIRLMNTWQRYQVSLDETKLTCVIGAFSWSASVDANPDGATFYIDQIRFE